MTVMVYLVSGMEQVGMIASFDQHAMLLRHGASMQLIYKHMIASILPAAKALPALSSSLATQTVSRPQSGSVRALTPKVACRTIIRQE